MSWKRIVSLAALTLTAAVGTSPARAQVAGAVWNRLVPADETTSPPATDHTCIYDPVRMRVISYGGEMGDVWELRLDGPPVWRAVSVSGSLAPQQTGAVAVYDSKHDRMIVFGGLSSEVWALSIGDPLPSWTRLAPAATGPQGRTGTAVAYDSQRDRLLLFGGLAVSLDAGSLDTNDIWALSLGDEPRWEHVSPQILYGGGPVPRERHGAIYDPVRDRLIVFGGESAFLSFNDTWEFPFHDPAGWHRIAMDGPPPGRWGHTATYDPAGDRMIVFGGTTDQSAANTFNDTWALSLSGVPHWSPITEAPAPAARWGHTAVLDPGQGRMIVVGGNGAALFRDTWAMALAGEPGWARLTPDPSRLPPLAGASAALDSRRQRVLVCGGQTSDPDLPPGVWAFPSSGAGAWSRLEVAGPVPAAQSRIVYDPVRDRLIAMGESSDGWTLALGDKNAAWQPLAVPGLAPPGRQGFTLTYDAALDAVVLFGGSWYRWYEPEASAGAVPDKPRGQWVPANDAWVLPLADGSEWRQLPNINFPRSVFLTLLDTRRHRLLAYDGNPGVLWEMSLLDLSGWHAPTLPHPIAPIAAFYYDEPRDALMGFDSGFAHMWVHALGDSVGWDPVTVGGSVPPARDAFASVFDPVANRILLLGGRDGAGNLLDDTWGLSLDGVTATEVALVSMDATSARVALSWDAGANSGLEGTVERRPSDGAWITLGYVDADAAGRIAFEDVNVVPGMRYAYRLAYVAAGERHTTPEAWVEVPAAPRFMIDGIQPNPAPNEVRVAFSLARGGDAVLDLFDLQGRSVARRDFHALAPGAHFVTMPGTAALAPAVYLLRLSQGLESRTTKVVLAR